MTVPNQSGLPAWSAFNQPRYQSIVPTQPTLAEEFSNWQINEMINARLRDRLQNNAINGRLHANLQKAQDPTNRILRRQLAKVQDKMAADYQMGVAQRLDTGILGKLPPDQAAYAAAEAAWGASDPVQQAQLAQARAPTTAGQVSQNALTGALNSGLVQEAYSRAAAEAAFNAPVGPGLAPAGVAAPTPATVAIPGVNANLAVPAPAAVAPMTATPSVVAPSNQISQTPVAKGVGAGPDLTGAGAAAPNQSWDRFSQGIQAANSLLNMGIGLYSVYDTNRNYNFQRDFANTNLANSIKSYNDAATNKTLGRYSPTTYAKYKNEIDAQAQSQHLAPKTI